MQFWSLILKILCYTPTSLVTYFFMARMLRIERQGRFMIGMTALHIVVQFLHVLLLNAAVPWADSAKIIVQTLLYLFAAVAFSRQPLVRRLLALGLVFMSVLGGELASVNAFVLVGGSLDQHGVALASDTIFDLLFMFAVAFVVTAALLFMVWMLWERFVMHSSDRVTAYFSLFPLSQALILTVALYYAVTAHFEHRFYGVLSLTMVFCILSDYYLFRAIATSSRRAVAEERAVWYETLLEQQQSYYAQMLLDLEDASRIRHDMRNQLQTVYTLMQQGESDAARQQLDDLNASLELSHTFCANRVVNALLNVKEKQYAGAGVTLRCSCDVPSDLPYTGVELCSLFSNVLDNALNAAASCPPSDRDVSLTSGMQGGFFILNCVNPYLQDAAKKKRTQTERHGLGLEILRELAERYSGELKTEQTNGRFSCTVWLSLDADPSAPA